MNPLFSLIMTGWNEEGFSSSLGLLHLEFDLGFKHWMGAISGNGSNYLHLCGGLSPIIDVFIIF